MKRLFPAMAALSALLLSACTADYRALAVEDAREFALDHAKNLTAVQRNFVRYNDPVIMNAEIRKELVPQFPHNEHLITRYDNNLFSDPERDLMYQCIVWIVPGLDGQLIVTGTSQRDFKFWSSDRVVIKRTPSIDSVAAAVRKMALEYAMNAMPELSEKDRLTVRFADPEVLTTKFPLDPKPEDPASTASIPANWMDYLKEAASGAEPVQVSAVWPGADGSKIIITGLSRDGQVGNWKPEKAHVVPVEELQKYTLGKYVPPPVVRDGTTPAAPVQEFIRVERNETVPSPLNRGTIH